MSDVLLENLMGFADLSIAELAEDYQLQLSAVLLLCDQLQIPYHDANSLLSLEDAKRIILAHTTRAEHDPPSRL